MLAIRLQRTGRKGHAQYRVVVQDSHRSPLSGNVVEYLGSYNPHAKTVSIDKEKAQKFLDNGAQPSDRVVGLLKSEGVKLPKWVEVSAPGKRTTRNPEKLRRNQPEKPAEEVEEKPAAEKEEAPAEDAAPESPAPEAETVEATEAPAEEATSEAKPE